jgi:general secretion pathway protein G
VPLEPSLALHGGHLFATATPQALVAALDHARRGGDDLLDHPALRASALGDEGDLQSLFFSDTPRLLRAGYGPAVALAAAVANGLRSPADPVREPGLVLPTFAELCAGARPTISWARFEGDDLVTRGEFDRSVAVHVTAMLGWMPSVMGGTLLAGAMGALVAPLAVREATAQTRAQGDIAALVTAVVDYAVENMGVYPDSLAALVTPDENGLTYLNTTTVPLDPWGNPYGYELVDGRPRVFSLGADGAPGGEGEARDISRGLFEPEDGEDPQ